METKRIEKKYWPKGVLKTFVVMKDNSTYLHNTHELDKNDTITDIEAIEHQTLENLFEFISKSKFIRLGHADIYSTDEIKKVYTVRRRKTEEEIEHEYAEYLKSIDN